MLLAQHFTYRRPRQAYQHCVAIFHLVLSAALISSLLSVAPVLANPTFPGTQVALWVKTGAKSDDYTATAKACHAAIPMVNFTWCMHRHGWRLVKPSSDDLVALGAVRSEQEYARWYDKFLASSDVAKQLSAAASRLQLPEFDAEPLTYGGMRFNPDSLTPAGGVVQANGVLLKGAVQRWRTAQIASYTPIGQTSGFGFDAGTVLHAQFFKDPHNNEFMYWCGSSHARSVDHVVCVRNDDQGFVFVPAQGYSWLVDGIELNQYLLNDLPVSLKVNEHDEIGPIEFSITLKNFNQRFIELEGRARYRNETEVVWRSGSEWSSAGMAKVPFWSRQMVLTRSGTGVTVAYDKAENSIPLADARPLGP